MAELSVEETVRQFDALYERLRKQVQHENELYNQRIIWLITMQAFLFATIGLLMEARVQQNAGAWQGQIDGFIVLVSALGILVSLVSNRLLNNARNALRNLRAFWDKEATTMPAGYGRF